MKQRFHGAEVTSTLSPKQAAQIFRSTTEQQGRKIEFFTPVVEDSPFDVFEEQPDFSVGAAIRKIAPGRRYKNMLKGALFHDLDTALASPMAVIHMYVFDSGSSRTIEFYSPYEMGGGSEAQQLVHTLVESFKHSDSSATVRYP